MVVGWLVGAIVGGGCLMVGVGWLVLVGWCLVGWNCWNCWKCWKCWNCIE